MKLSTSEMRQAINILKHAMFPIAMHYASKVVMEGLRRSVRDLPMNVRTADIFKRDGFIRDVKSNVAWYIEDDERPGGIPEKLDGYMMRSLMKNIARGMCNKVTLETMIKDAIR